MTITENELNTYLSNYRFHVSQDKKKEILTMFSTEPEDDFQWTEQDIYEQIRKLVRWSDRRRKIAR